MVGSLSNNQKESNFIFTNFCISLLRLRTKHDALKLPFSPSSSSPQLFRNICEFGGKRFPDHRAANKLSYLFLVIKRYFSGLFFFWTSCSKVGKIHQRLLDKCDHLFICISSKYSLQWALQYPFNSIRFLEITISVM